MKYDPLLHHRRSIRLRGYDYSQEGAYFITICAHHRRCIFGHIENKEMILNEYGQVAWEEWEKLPERWPHVELGAFQIMPNHVHGIIIIHDHVGVPLAGTQHAEHVAGTQHADTDDVVSVGRVPARGTPTAGEMRTTQIQWTHNPTAGQITGAYQSCVSTGCLKIAKSKQPELILGKLWQRNFWEHIIRDLRAFDTISNYIITNPENWEGDKFYNPE